MTKTHNDLDAILQLLQEKEKDLELAAQIGQSLLERNKSLMHKTEVMEKYLGEHTDREEQLRHDIVRKNDLLQKFLKDQEDLFLETDNKSEDDAKSSETASLLRDDSFGTLQDKCHVLEKQNTSFILEALHLKEQTASEEQKERELVADCVHQLIEAKDQITALTDDIARKAEDNVRQQEEISQLIDTVVDLQKRHSQLSMDNEELQSLLNSSQLGQDELKEQIADLQEKYSECFEILMENQQEMKSLNQKIETPLPKQSSPALSLDGRDSIAQEIEQSVKRDLANIQERRQNLTRVLQTVRNINLTKEKKPKKVARPPTRKTEGSSTGFKFNPITDLPRNASETSLDGEDSVSGSSHEPRHSYTRRSFRKPEKLQIVKPIKGSLTLQQWKKLASPTMNLEQQRPGVHVKNAVQSTPEVKHAKEQSDTSDAETDEDQPIQMRIRSKPPEQVSSITSEEPHETHRETRRDPPTTLALSSLVYEKGFLANSRRGSATASILAQLLNSPSASTSRKSSVGQVLAEVLNKASEEASGKEPKRAESLRNLANYFSEKEKEGKSGPEAIQEDDSPPVSPPDSLPVLPVTGGSANIGGGILSRLLVGSTGINVSIPTTPRPTATVAGSISTPTSSSTSVSSLRKTGFGRTSSGTNLKQLDTTNLNSSLKRHSLDVSSSGFQAKFPTEVPIKSVPTLRRRASSGDLESMSSSSDLAGNYNDPGNRLYRSNSSGSLNDLTQNVATSRDNVKSGGIFGRLTRRPSLGSLTDLIQRSHIGTVPVPPSVKLERASSIDSGLVPNLQSPPSPSHCYTNDSFFQQSTQASPKGFLSGSKLSSLAGIRGMWAQGPSSTPEVTPSQLLGTSSVKNSEERLEKINKAFAFEDFGGMGLMSLFGNKASSQDK